MYCLDVVSCGSMCFFCASHGWTLFDQEPYDASWIWKIAIHLQYHHISSFINSWLWALGQTNWNPQIVSTELWFYIIHNSSFKKWLHFFLCWTCFSVHVSHGLELKSLQRGLRGWNGQIAVVAVSVRLSAPFRLFPFHSVTLSNKSHGPSWFAFLDYCMHNLGSSRHRAQKIKSV